MQRYRVCPSAQLTGSDGESYSHFEVLGTSCAEAVAVMRRFIRGRTAPPGSGGVEGWEIERSSPSAYLGRKGRARFACYIDAG